MYSVLSEFILSCILSTQSLILLNVSFSNCLEVVSCYLFPALIVFHREWSSAKPLILTESGTTSLMRAQQQVKMFVPLQDPCGMLKLYCWDSEYSSPIYTLHDLSLRLLSKHLTAVSVTPNWLSKTLRIL